MFALQHAMAREPNTHTSTMIPDKFDPSGFESTPNCGGVGGGNLGDIVRGIRPPDGGHAQARGIGEFLSGPPQQGAACPDLRTRDRGCMHEASPLFDRMIEFRSGDYTPSTLHKKPGSSLQGDCSEPVFLPKRVLPWRRPRFSFSREGSDLHAVAIYSPHSAAIAER
jgi:hypothetical protein